MVANDGERIAANTQAIQDMRGDVQELRESMGRFGARLGAVETEMSTLLTDRRTERRIAQQRQEAIQTWLRLMTAAIAFGGLLMTAATLITTIYFK